ncbi:hypothetical protein DXG03_001362 [Asterophora parasitica]|uniref:Uncharacterized protein n=1 Tax=Asterophora parasitica TaxID=117018 RepID=A0A9P7KBT1_9AGAR|nr:hypothetical protein DXG03_001362 [Asterophora parasitica]
MGQYFTLVHIDNCAPVQDGIAGIFGEAFWAIRWDSDACVMNAIPSTANFTGPGFAKPAVELIDVIFDLWGDALEHIRNDILDEEIEATGDDFRGTGDGIIFDLLSPLLVLWDIHPNAGRKRLQAHYQKKYLGELQYFLMSLADSDFGDYVLRNLVTREFVRGDTIRAFWKKPSGAEESWLKMLRFEHVLVYKTTWSADDSLAIMYEGPIQVHRGAWAGHRFHFSSIKSAHNDDGVSKGGWKDASCDIFGRDCQVFDGEM